MSEEIQSKIEHIASLTNKIDRKRRWIDLQAKVEAEDDSTVLTSIWNASHGHLLKGLEDETEGAREAAAVINNHIYAKIQKGFEIKAF